MLPSLVCNSLTCVIARYDRSKPLRLQHMGESTCQPVQLSSQKSHRNFSTWSGTLVERRDGVDVQYPFRLRPLLRSRLSQNFTTLCEGCIMRAVSLAE